MQTNTTNFGAIVGRVANRIKGAQFTLNGTTYHLVKNTGNNSIHGMLLLFHHQTVCSNIFGYYQTSLLQI